MWLVVVLGLFLLYEAVICIRRKYFRRVRYAQARDQAKQTGRKLLVVGDPKHGLASIVTGADYEHGDVCADLTGCPRAGPNVLVLKGDAAKTLAQLKDDNNYVVFMSCTLEYVDDPETLTRHLLRLAGSARNIYTVTVERWSFEAYFYPGRLIGDQGPKRIVTCAPPMHPYFAWFEV
jgi:hypothetical protein